MKGNLVATFCANDFLCITASRTQHHKVERGTGRAALPTKNGGNGSEEKMNFVSLDVAEEYSPATSASPPEAAAVLADMSCHVAREYSLAGSRGSMAVLVSPGSTP